MSTKFLSPGWRMPRNANQSKSSNYSLDFTFADASYIDFGNNIPTLGYVNSTDTFSISTWVNTAWGSQYVFGNRDSTSGFSFTTYPLASSPEYNGLLLRVGSTDIVATLDRNDLIYNSWVHFVWVYDGSGTNNSDKIKAYQNGIPLSLTFPFGNFPSTISSNLNFYAGAYTWTGTLVGQYEGGLNELSIFDYALSQSQVTTLHGDSTNGPGNPMALPSPPIAYYPLGESAGGFVGGTGTWLTENNAIGDYVFDFDSDLIKVNQGSGINISGNLTLSAWVYMEDSTWNPVISKSANADNRNYEFAIRPTTRNISFYTNNGSYEQTSTSLAVSLNTWTHIVISCESGVTNGTKFYFNNALDTTTGTHTVAADTADLYLGTTAWNSFANYFNGQISNVQIWNTNLSTSEVETLYNYGSPIRTLANIPQNSNLKAWYKLDATEIYNSSSTEWEVNNALSPWTSSLNFNGSSDYINLDSFAGELSTGDAYGLSVWFKVDVYKLGALFSAHTSSRGNVVRLLIRGSDIQYFDGGNNGTFLGDYDDNKWHNVVVTKSTGTSTLTLYIDGSSIGTISNCNPDFSNATLFSIGQEWDPAGTSDFFSGQISNVQIFNTALPATGSNSVETIYNNGVPLTDMSSFSSLVSWWKLDNTTTGIEDSKGSNNGTNNGATEAPGSVSTLNGESTGMSQSNLVQSDLQTVAPYSKYAMNFDGSVDYLIADNLNNTFASATNMTVSAWVNPSHTSTSNYYYSIVNQWNYSANIGWGLWLHSSGSTNSALHWNQEAAGGSVEDTVKRIATNTWSHVAVVKEGTSLKMYYNGSLVHTGTVGLTTGSSVNKLTIGAQNLGTAAFFDGSISNVSIWNAALTFAQVTEIYNEGLPSDLHNFSGAAPVAWWQLGENSSFTGDWICADEIGSSNGDSGGMGVDALTNGVGTTANGTSTGMSEGSLIGDAPYSTANAMSSGMPITARGTDVPS